MPTKYPSEGDAPLAPLSARVRARLRLSGALDALLDEVLSLAAAPPPRAAAASAALAAALARLARAVERDADAAMHSARAHAALARLCAGGREGEGEDGAGEDVAAAADAAADVADAAAAVVGAFAAALTPLELAFPLPAATPLPDAPMHFDFSGAIALPAVDAALLGLAPVAAAAAASPLEAAAAAAEAAAAAAAVSDVWVRCVPSSVRRQRSQEDVGQLLWPAAPPLCRWLCAHRRLLLRAAGGRGGGARVLEVGSGMGLCGIVAALLLAGAPNAPPVTMSDFNAVVIANLVHNCALNEPERAAARGGVRPPCMRAVKLDWSASEEDNDAELGAGADADADADADGRFDVVLGSDMICGRDDAQNVAALLQRRLRRPAGVAVLLLAPSDVRWGVEALAPALAARGLLPRERELDARYVAGAAEQRLTQSGGYESRLRLHVVRWAEAEAVAQAEAVAGAGVGPRDD